MSPKKPHQRRLPTVLPPAQVPVPRVAPELASPPAELHPGPDAVPDPEPDPMPVPGPRPPPDDAFGSWTIEAPADSRDDDRDDDLDDDLGGRRGRRTALVVVALACLLGGGALAYAVLLGQDDAPPVPDAGGTAAPELALGPARSRVETQVMASGDLVVRQTISAEEPLTSLALDLPVVAGAEELSADQVEVLAGGAEATGPDRIVATGAIYTFEASTEVLVTYRLRGALQVSDSVTGRALAVVTHLPATYAPMVEREVRSVRAPTVLALACSRPPDGSPRPCGTEAADSRWQVELTGDAVGDRVLAQLDLG